MVYYIWFEKHSIIVVILFVVVFFTTEYLAVYKPVNRMHKKKKEILDFYFEKWVEGARYDGKKPKIRVSILLKKYHYINFHFLQYYQYNIEDYQDCNLHFRINKGFAGVCFKKDMANAPYLCDLREYKKEEILNYYNFNNKLYENTKHVKAITCVPMQKKTKSLFHPEVYKYKKIGVFSIDAVDEIGANFLSEKEVLQEIKYLYKFVEKIYT